MFVKENVHPTSTQSIIIQAIVSTTFLAELHNSNFLDSEYFKSMHFDNESYKAILKQSGIGNPAVMQFALYSYLVIPRELLSREEYEPISFLHKNIDNYIATIVEKETYSSYPRESTINSIKYCNHIRNAIAHSKTVYETEGNTSYVTFIDERKRDNCKCEIKLKTHYIGEILGRLSDALTFYFIETLK